LFAELLALRIHYNGQVHVCRGFQPHQLLQIYLARSGVEQIGAAHHIGDPLCGIIHYYRKLVGEQSIGTLHDEIADFSFEVLGDAALQRIVEFNNSIFILSFVIPAQAGIQQFKMLFIQPHWIPACAGMTGYIKIGAHPPSSSLASGRNAIATSAGIYLSIYAMQRRIRDLLACAATRVHRTSSFQSKKGFLVGGSALALVNDVFIPVQAVSFQRAENFIGSTLDGARGVEVFDAHQPLALMMFGIEIAADGGDE